LESFQQVLVGEEISGLWHFFLLEIAKIKKEKLPLQGKIFVKWQTIHFFL
jgi:hypothetical protein